MRQQVIDFLRENGKATTDDINAHLGRDLLKDWAKTRLMLDDMAHSGSLKRRQIGDRVFYEVGQCKQEN